MFLPSSRSSIGRTAAVASLIVMMLAGCRAGRGSRPPADPRDPYLITAVEIEGSARLNLFDLVQELRPNWFTRRSRGRSGEVLVYIDERPLGNASSLRRFSTNVVASVRYLSATEAQVRYGQVNGGRAAIVVELVKD
jgi:hypothetical protein